MSVRKRLKLGNWKRLEHLLRRVFFICLDKDRLLRRTTIMYLGATEQLGHLYQLLLTLETAASPVGHNQHGRYYHDRHERRDDPEVGNRFGLERCHSPRQTLLPPTRSLRSRTSTASWERWQTAINMPLNTNSPGRNCCATVSENSPLEKRERIRTLMSVRIIPKPLRYRNTRHASPMPLFIIPFT